MSKRLLALLAAIFAVGLIAGCGSDDGELTVTTSSLSKAEFIKQGDAICEKGTEAIEKEAEEFVEENDVDTSNPTREQRERVVAEVVAPGIRTQVEEIAALGAPSGDEDEVAAIIEAFETAADEAEDDPSLLAEAEGAGVFKGANELAEDYGFTACAEE